MAAAYFARFSDKSAFVVGYTGEIGKELVRELLEKKIFKQLILVGRRNVVYEDHLYSTAEQKVVNFDELENHKDVFNNCEFGFCCLGTTRAIAGALFVLVRDGFVKVDHDYVVNVAKVAKEVGCKHFTVVSSQGANKNALILYSKTKGLMEEHVSEVPYERITIMRPAFLLCDRTGDRRILEKTATFLMKPLIWAKPTFITVPTVSVAKAIIYNLNKTTDAKTEIIDNATIHQLSNKFDELFSKNAQ